MSKKIDEARTCFVCGAALSGLDESCPVCMLREGLAGGFESGESSISEVSTNPTSEQAAQRFEHYELVLGQDGKPVELGRGAMGITYKAFDTVLRHAVALKVIDARIATHLEARERFLREARAAARLRHPNIASVFYYGVRKSDDQCFYTMELVEGETLEAHLRRGPLPVASALEVVAQVAKALIAAEAQELVHRDLKPANLMLIEGLELSVKLIDFGLARAVVTARSEADLTHGGFVGTPAFASPEQFTGAHVDIRSDLYSLGITLWEMLTGQSPFRGSPTEVMDLHQRGPLPLEQLKRVPQPVVALLEVLLEKDPARRLQSPADLLKALAKVTDAVKTRRSITGQTLREMVDKRPGASGKAVEILTTFREIIAARRVRLILWAALVLVIGAGGILPVNHFFAAKVHAPQVSGSASPAATASEKSLAVLPFESLSESKSDAYFADGVQDEILNNLARISQLKVICRTSVMQYRPEAKRDLREIANALGVANVLEGTVRRDGNHVRVNTELVDVRNYNTIWADSYDRDLIDIFAIQSEIAKTVASRLRAHLSPEERKDIEEKPTNNLEAYDLYLQAKQQLEFNYWTLVSSDKETFSKIVSLLEEAIRKDPRFALAYCLIAKAHDVLYAGRTDHTPERRALGDAAVNEALRLRPDLPEVHLAIAFHLYSSGDFERARIQVAIAAQALPNNSDLLELTADIDQVQGHWENSTAGLERAATLDPRNPRIFVNLADTYHKLRRYRDAERIADRLIALDPAQPLNPTFNAQLAFDEKADLKRVRAAYEALPSSVKNDLFVEQGRNFLATCARDFAAAEEIVSKSPNEEMALGIALVPRRIIILWLQFLRGNHPTLGEFGAAREELYRRVKADPSDPFLLMALAFADVSLGHSEDAMQEGRRATELRPISEDAVDGPIIAYYVAIVYALANQPDLAFDQLNILVELPTGSSINYGCLKTFPGWDPLRKDPRFNKLLAELAPRD